MVPMALALERGSQMQAPLGRAVIGGLVMSTVATLLVVPSIFALLIGRSVARSPSLYPDDPDSPHYDPLAFAREGEPGPEATPAAGQPVPSRPEVGLRKVDDMEVTPPSGQPVRSRSQPDEAGHAPDGGHAPGPAPSAPPEETPLPGDP
jgi:hypothetical protein